jgi:transcriptional regulator with XRE-family HTH domain|nr:helix-turn-helix transcriptional regulator [Roseburia intestinalis]
MFVYRDGRCIRRSNVKPIYLSIQQEATGNRIRELLLNNGYTVKDIQEVMGFENPQAVYKWLSGKSLPNLDNLLILSKVLHTSIEDILVIDGDIAILMEGATQWIMYGIKQIFGMKEKDRGRYLVLCCGI